MKTLGEMSVSEQDEVFRRLMNRSERTESLLFGSLDNPSQGLFAIVTQLTQAVATQGLQINKLESIMQDGLSKKMDIVVDETNQPVSVSILAHDLSEIRKMVKTGITWLSGIGVMSLLLLGRAAYNIFPVLQNIDKH